MIRTGLDRLLAAPARLRGRRFGVLAHPASVSAEATPIHLALSRDGCRPARLFGPEHGFYAVEQDMVAAGGGSDPWTGLPIVSLYGDHHESLRPVPAAFDGLDLLVVDLQDVGARYYTYAATAVWAAEAALHAGCEVWILDRPNPLGGDRVEGNLGAPEQASFVGAFRLPVRHGLTLGELVRLEASRRGWSTGIEVLEMAGWERSMRFTDTGLPWIAPSPNMPTPRTAEVYPGSCLIEATCWSEGRGTTRPFQLIGAPGVDPPALVAQLAKRELPGVVFMPTYFRPQFQKHRGELCGGVEIVVTKESLFAAYRTGVELLAALSELAGQPAWRAEPYEFEHDRPAIDLLTGSTECRLALAAGAAAGRERLTAWMASWAADEASFREERAAILLYPEARP